MYVLSVLETVYVLAETQHIYLLRVCRSEMHILSLSFLVSGARRQHHTNKMPQGDIKRHPKEPKLKRDFFVSASRYAF